jgi:hypothetical protein
VASLNTHESPLHEAPADEVQADDNPLTAAQAAGSDRGRRRFTAPNSRVAYAVGIATVCTLAAVNLLSASPAATAETRSSVAVADALGITDAQTPVARDAEVLGDLVASRSERETDEATAAASQSQAEQAAAAAKAQAEAQAAAEAAAAAQAAEAAAAAAASAPKAGPAPAAAAAPAAGIAAGVVAKITNSSGPVEPQTQAAANAVVSNVPGAAVITLGGTRASAADPHGHPSGLALDYMVLSDNALGEAIIAYHKAHWAELGVDYLIYKQRMLSSPNGSWVGMEDRGSPTANHMDHVHVNYR